MSRTIPLISIAALLVALLDDGTAAQAQAQALADPAAAKAADACQKALLQGGAGFATATSKGLGGCFDALFTCVQTKPDDAGCVAKAVAKCAKDTDVGRAKRVAKLAGALTKKCASIGDLIAAEGLGYTTHATACADAGTPLADPAAVAACVRAELECRAEHAFAVAMPRARGLANAAGITTRAGSCLDDLGGAGNVGDPKAVGKPLAKCQRAVEKAAAGFVATKLKGLGKCTAAIFGCVQKKPGDQACLDKARSQCTKLLTVDVPAAEAKVESAIAASCATIFSAAGTPDAIGVAALAPTCQQYGVAALATVGDWARCVMRQHECTVEAMLPFTAPRFVALLADLGLSAASPFCGPGASPTPTASPTASAADTPTPTVTVTATATATLSPTPTPTATQPPNVVFVSSQPVTTDLGGATAYDAQCNAFATAAGINNATDDAFVAWISDSTSNAVTRLGSARGFVRVDGAPFADTVADLTAGKLFSPLRVTETGTVISDVGVMTGTLAQGTVGTDTCSDWTGVGSALGGAVRFGPPTWTSFLSISCATPRRIYCFMKTRSTVVAPSPASGKRIFLTDSTFLPGNGTPDALCESEKPAGTGSVVALLARSTAAAATLLAPATTYVRPDGTAVGTGQDLIDTGFFQVGNPEFLASGAWQTASGSYVGGLVWTGSTNVSNVPLASETCNDWTTSIGNGNRGDASSTGSGYWDGGTSACGANNLRLYCIEQ